MTEPLDSAKPQLIEVFAVIVAARWMNGYYLVADGPGAGASDCNIKYFTIEFNDLQVNFDCGVIEQISKCR